MAEVDPASIASPPTNSMDLDIKKPSGRIRNMNDSNLVDDEDLQAVLARQRRLKVKKAKPLDPEAIARKST